MTTKITSNLFKKRFYYCLIIGMACIFISCKKFLEVPPTIGQLSTAQIFSDTLLTDNAMRAIYISLVSVGEPGYKQTLVMGLAADELDMASPTGNYQQILNNTITADNSNVASFWSDYYNILYTINLNLENLENNQKIDAKVRDRFIGEAHFLRAFAYFQLINVFGDVPLILHTDYATNMTIPRTPVSQIYTQINADLQQASTMLADQYPGAVTIRANKWMVQALWSQVYLYQQNWQMAESTADLILQSGRYSLVTVDQAFIKNNKEAIFQLAQYSTGAAQRNLEAYFFVPGSTTTIPTYPIKQSLVSAFDNGDIRKTAWIKSNTIKGVTYYYPYKYTAVSQVNNTRDEYTTIFRLGEQYLIRAEAAAQLGHLDLAISSIDSIRKRAQLPLWKTVSPVSSQQVLLTEIYKERRLELMVERGHRWDDLRRTNQANTVLGTLKTGWKSTAALFPVPLTELYNNPYLKQNPGY